MYTGAVFGVIAELAFVRMRSRAAVAVLCFLPLAAQPVRPEFEVASVRPSTPGNRIGFSGGPGTSDPTLLRCTSCSLQMLIERAFELKMYQINGPDWLRTLRFDITAKIPEGATRPQALLMLQDLLNRRFKVTATRSRKEMSVYELSVIKDTHKLTEWVDPPDGRQPVSGISDASDGGVIRRMAGWPMETVIAWLEITVERPIIDQTGLKGRYDLSIHYSPNPNDTNPGSDLIEALRTQLVVDHIERAPSEN